MHDKRWPIYISVFLISWLSSIGLAQDKPAQDDAGKTQQPDYPSQQLLEFLADFGGVDEQTYELIEYHALQRDSQQQQEKPNDE